MCCGLRATQTTVHLFATCSLSMPVPSGGGGAGPGDRDVAYERDKPEVCNRWVCGCVSWVYLHASCQPYSVSYSDGPHPKRVPHPSCMYPGGAAGSSAAAGAAA